ncbi:PP2C family protein-serine/threonine phosphatase [Streptomyces sp. NBC_00102]|uniref:PP2C family protein-serine/threonine phosphatase n=1 Tax=Streptomyces sp. NBC_00102 TaxID=2975652 RepID=UPI0022542382|nr:PP2C family protein-serine/threonine phosphatase [Streptomyces sp. NBC_00102]MCX5398304.1 serine/threonine-protein phosphatase [Streptomyces sp. NBC_00102]
MPSSSSQQATPPESDPVSTPQGSGFLRRQPLLDRAVVVVLGRPRRRLGWLLPLALLVVVCFADWNTSGDFRVLSWLVVVPVVAAALCPVGTTALFAVAAVIAYRGIDQAWEHEYRAGLPDFILVSMGGLLAVAAAWLRRRGERRALAVRNVADTTRATVIRPLPPSWGGLLHAHIYLPADAEARLGGDFYDVQPSPWGTRALLGDVQGKGLGAVAVAANLLGTFREAGFHQPDLRVVAERMEIRMERNRLYEQAMGYKDGDRFATAVLLDFPAPGSTGGYVDVINFGHDPPFAVSARGVRRLDGDRGRLPLGLNELAPASDRSAGPYRVRVADDETLLLTTDGVTEARDRAGDFFPLAEALEAAVTEDPQLAESPYRLVRAVRDRMLRHVYGQLQDDTTIFAVRVAPSSAGPVPQALPLGEWTEFSPSTTALPGRQDSSEPPR